MKSEPRPSPEFAKFDALVGRVLSLPKADLQRMKAEEERAKSHPKKKSLK
jgi:hypothetical protein